MKIKRIEHIGVIVADLEKSRALWEDCFGVRLGYTEEIEGKPIRIAMYPVGETLVELIAGSTPESKHAAMVREGKGGLHHICFEVEDIDEAMRELRSKGVPFLDEAPRRGHANSRIAFIDPSFTDNMLIEIAELPGEAEHA